MKPIAKTEELSVLPSLCRGLAEQAPLPMAGVEGTAHVLRYVNPAFCVLMNKTSGQLLGKRFADLMKDETEFLKRLDDIFAGGKSQTYFEEQPTGPNSYFWSYTMWPLAVGGGQSGIMIQVSETSKLHKQTVEINEALLLGALRQHELTVSADHLNVQLQQEIVARQKVSQELLETAQRLSEKARLIDLSNDAIIVRDLDNKIRLWNKGAERLFGWTFEEVVGRDLHSFLGTEFPKPKEEIIAQLHRDGRYNGEVTQVARDGRRVRSLCGWVLDRGTDSIFTSYTDITERTKAVDALRENEWRLRYATESARLTYVETDFIQRLARMPHNFAAVMGYALSSDQEVDMSVAMRMLLDHVVPQDRRRVEIAHGELAGGTLAGSVEYRVLGDDNVERWIESRWSLQATADGTPLKSFATNLDITERKAAEELLRQNRDTFFNLIENAPFGLYVVDSEFRMQQVSAGSQKVFSHVRPLIGRDFAEIQRAVWPEPFASETIRRFRHTLETGDPYIAPTITENRQDIDAVESYDWKLERVTLPDGKYGVVCYFYDMTERRKNEGALRESEERYRSLFNTMDDGFCTIEVLFDEVGHPVDHRFLEANPAFEKHTGIKDPIGKLMSELSPGYEQYWNDLYGRVVITGVSERTENRVEVLDRWLNVFVSRVGEAANHKVALVFNDVTERRLTQEALRKSEKRYRNLFTSIDEGFCVIEMIFDDQDKPVDYRFLEMNPSFEIQSGIQGGLGRRMREIAPHVEAHWLDNYGDVALTGKPIRFSNEMKSLSRWFDVYAFRLGGEESRKVAVLFTNITDRTEAESALRQARAQLADRAKQLAVLVNARTAELTATNNQLEAFVYSIAHDLRSPLRSMQGFAEMLIEEAGASLSVTGKDYASRISGSARYLDALLRDLLAFSFIAQQQIELTPMSLDGVVQGVVSRLMETIREKNGAVELVGPWPSVMAHKSTLGQVLTNLVSNALKFVAPGVQPAIRILAEEGHESTVDQKTAPHASIAHSFSHPRHNFVRVWVEDNGIGIAADHQNEIFRLFTRLQGDKFSGTGIGLAIVQKGVERMGGTMGLESIPGHGSRFWFDLRKA